MKRFFLSSMVFFMVVLGLACAGSGSSGEGVSREPGTSAPPVAEVDSDDAGNQDDQLQAESTPEAAPPWQLPLPDLGYNARQGQALFQHYCATCHGNEGRGDGFNAFNLDPKPRDLSATSFQNEKSDQDLVDVIMIGGGAAGLSTGMPPWGRTLSKRQVQNLVIYLRTLEPES